MRHTYPSDQSNDWILYVRGCCGRRISSLAKRQHPSVHLARHGQKSRSFNGVELYWHKESNDYWQSACSRTTLKYPVTAFECKPGAEGRSSLPYTGTPKCPQPNLAERPGPAANLYVRTVNDAHELEPNSNHGVSYLRHPQTTVHISSNPQLKHWWAAYSYSSILYWSLSNS